MSSIIYNGKVFLRKTYKGRYRGRQELHNNGTTILFNQLCQALLGNTGVMIPKYLDVASGEETSENNLKFTSKLLGGAPIEGTLSQSTIDDAPCLNLNFKLSYKNLSSITQSDNIYFVVRGSSTSQTSYNISGGDVLMYLKLDSFSMEEGEAQEIFWKLYFQNPTSSD